MRTRRRPVTALRRLLAVTLAAALAALLAPVAAQADPGDYPGKASYPTYNSRFWAGPAIGHLSSYIPQGLAYWSAKDSLITTYYDEDDTGAKALISVRNRLGKQTERKWVTMVGGHAGGAVVHGKYLWVSSTSVNGLSWVYRYSLSRLNAAKPHQYLTYDKAFPVRTSSYVTVRGGDLWVGRHTTSAATAGTLYRYDITAAGNLSKNPIASMTTPGLVQSATFSNGRVIYSRSYGRRNASTITVVNLSTGRSSSFAAPSMTQGATLAAGWYYLTTESGASHYRYGEDGRGRSLNPITRTHYASASGLTGLV